MGKPIRKIDRRRFVQLSGLTITGGLAGCSSSAPETTTPGSDGAAETRQMATSQPAEDASSYLITARDAGDITGGLNAADAELGMDVRDTYATFFDQTFNRGRLQRAERPASRDPNTEYPLPLPPQAGGEFGQAAVYNRAVEYDPSADQWSVVDSTFDTEAALYLANQDIWISQWGGEFYGGRGVPGKNDEPS